jgi:hypothetical protein
MRSHRRRNSLRKLLTTLILTLALANVGISVTIHPQPDYAREQELVF